MKNLLNYSILVLIICSCKGQVNEINVKSDKANLDSLETAGFEAYSNDPKEAVEIFKKLAKEYRKVDYLKKAGQTNLNIAGIYEEKLSNYTAALHYAKESLHDWKMYNDTSQIANLFKYVGYLEGLNKNFDKAKMDVQTAIDMYTEINFNKGIAVSNINMAKIYLMENKNEDARNYFEKSKEFWLMEDNYSRVFDNNLVGIAVFRNLNQPKQAKELIKENELILKNNRINEFLEDKFKKIKEEIR